MNDESEGTVATHLRSVGIYYKHFTVNLLLSTHVRNFGNRSAFGEVVGCNISSTIFLSRLTMNE